MHGLYLLWWVREQQIPSATVAAVLAAGDLALTAVEVPTGWFADVCGHRVSLILGSVLQIAGMLFCWLGRGVGGLLAASLLVALGDAFRSGADQALLYRSCRAIGREAAFQAVEARSRFAQLVALVALVLAGGAVVGAWGFAAGWLVETALSACGLIIACGMAEPPADRAGGSVAAMDADEHFVDPVERTRSGSPAGELGRLLGLILPASLLGSAASAASFLAQTSGDATTSGLTTLVAIVVLAEAAGAGLAAHARSGARTGLALAAAGAALVAGALASQGLFLPTVVGLSFLLGLAQPLRAASIQRMSADRARARAASLASACDQALGTVTLVAAGVLSGRG